MFANTNVCLNHISLIAGCLSLYSLKLVVFAESFNLVESFSHDVQAFLKPLESMVHFQYQYVLEQEFSTFFFVYGWCPW